MRPPQEHIERALRVECSIEPDEKSNYLEIMNQLPMSQRTTDQQLHDGCILTGIFERAYRNKEYII